MTRMTDGEIDKMLALKARAEAAEKEHQDFRLENDREWKAKVDYQKARAEAAEKREAALREALEEIEDLAFVKLIDAYSIARAALEAKP